MHKLIFSSILTLFSSSFICAQDISILPNPSAMQIGQHFQWVMKEMSNPQSKNVLVVAHRGDWRNAPENSIQALKNCIRMGVDVMEIDLKMTKDSVLVLMHDKTIDRTMSGKGEPKKYTLDSLKKMTLKSAHGGPTEHHIPTFEEFMLLAKGKMFINIDKCYPYYSEVIKVLKRTGTLNQVLMNGEKDLADNKTDYGELLHQIPFKPVVDLDKLSVGEIDDYIQFHPKAMELCFAKDTSRFIQHAEIFKKNNIKVYINSLWTTLCAGHNDDVAVEENKPDEAWGWLIQKGASIIQSDRPFLLVKYLETKGLRPKFN